MNKLLIVIIIALVSFSFADPSNDEPGALAKVEKIGGLYIYIRCQPVDHYESLGLFRGPKIVRSKNESFLVPKMLDRVRDKYPKANGVIFLTGKNLIEVEVIRFD